MFICGFISFTVWSSFTVCIISLSHSHIPPLRPVPVFPTLPAPSRWPLKFWALHCWKITGPPPSSASSSCSSRKSLSLTPIEYERVAFYLPLHLAISSLYLFWFVWISPLSVLVTLPYSTIRLLFRVCSLLGCLFSLVARICPILSSLVLVRTVLGVFSSLILYLSLSFSLSFSFFLSCNLFSSLSFISHLSLIIVFSADSLSFSFHSHSLCLASRLVLTFTICFSSCFSLALSFFLSLFFSLSLASSSY